MSAPEEWARYMRASGQSPATVTVRIRTILALANHAGKADPLDLTRADVINFLGRNIKPWTRLTYWKNIGKWSEFLREFGHVPSSDLTRGIRRPVTPQGIPRPISDETVARLLAAPLSPRASAYVRLALYQALRVHEIAKLSAEDFDFDSGWLTVTGKGGITASVPIHPEIRVLAVSMPEFGWWFRSPADPAKCVSAVAVSSTISNALQSVGSTAVPHQLRDTAGTQIQRQSRDIRVTQSALRHRSIRSTQKYTAVSDQDLQAAVLALSWPRDAA